MANTPQKLYGHFEPHERFVLMLEASARGDQAEADRIRASCPRKSYSGPDADFDDRRSMVLDVAMAACGDMGALVCQLRLLEWVKQDLRRLSALHHIDAQMALAEGIRCARGLPVSPYFDRLWEDASVAEEEELPDASESEQEDEEDRPTLPCDYGRRQAGVDGRSEHTTGLMLKVLEGTSIGLAAELAGIWSAFGRFCTSRVGLSPEKVLDGCGYPQRKRLSETLERYGQVTPNAATGEPYFEGLCRVWDRWFKGT